jgi:hypothetical protein
MNDDLNIALAEIARMRNAARRIIWMSENHPSYGKGRGQAAKEILESVSGPLCYGLDDVTASEVMAGVRARSQQNHNRT